jgi:hypothetical protein
MGVDELYILVDAWWLSGDGDVPTRTCAMLTSAGVAITLTSVASATSFAIGTITNLMAVQLFCAYASTTIMFNYVYQVGMDFEWNRQQFTDDHVRGDGRTVRPKRGAAT